MSHYLDGTEPMVEPTAAERIQENAIALDITYHCIGNKRSVATSHVETEIDKEWLHIQKEMLKSPELKKIRSFYYQTSKHLAVKSLPSLYRRGIFLIPNTMVAEVADYLEQRNFDLKPLVEDFLHAYPQRVEEAREQLGNAFDESNYPSQQELRGAFGIDYRFVSIGTPTSVNDVSRAIYLREQARVRDQFEEAAAVLMGTMRQQALGMVKALHERLNTPLGEKPKSFHASTINKLNQWAYDYLHGLGDVVMDEKLRPIAETIMMVTDVDAKDLRQDERFRADIARKVGEVEESLKKLLVDKPRRAVILE